MQSLWKIFQKVDPPLYFHPHIWKKNFQKNFVYLWSMINRVIDIYLKNFRVYYYKDWYWVINPVTNDWVVSVGDSGYTFFNRDFWKVFLMYYPSLDLTKDIQNWVVYKIGVPPNEHCYPDYIPGEHDWRDEFDLGLIIDVVNNGKTFN